MKDSDKDLESIEDLESLETLEALLKPLKRIQPSDLELQRWTSVARKQQKAYLNLRRRVSRQWFQVAAAGVVGFFIGWAVFGTTFLHKTESKDSLTEINNGATVEYVFTNYR